MTELNRDLDIKRTEAYHIFRLTRLAVRANTWEDTASASIVERLLRSATWTETHLPVLS